MFDDLAAYFHENVVASYLVYREVRENESYGLSKDTRTAVNAATSLYHLREHISSPQRKTREAIAKECPDYDVLGDIVNAAKHRDLDRGKLRLRSAEDIYELTVITQYEDSEGTYSNAQKVVMVKLLDGTERDILECLTNVMNYWGNEFVRLGLKGSYKPFDIPLGPGEEHVSREAAKGLDTEIIQGVRFTQTMKLLKFDSTTGKSEPIDLTGSELRYRIFKPSYVINFEHSHPTTGKKCSFELKLDEDQSFEWHSLKTDAEREAFAQRLAHEKQDQIINLLAKTLGEDRGEESGAHDPAAT